MMKEGVDDASGFWPKLQLVVDYGCYHHHLVTTATIVRKGPETYASRVSVKFYLSTVHCIY